jgi:transposase
MRSGILPPNEEDAMRPQTYRVELSEEEHVRLRLLVGQGASSARVIRRAHMLLQASEGAFDHQIAGSLHVHRTTVQRTRERFCAGGLDAALYERPRPGAEPKLDGRAEAFLVALACSEAPEGKEHWSLQMLADKLVALGLVEAISDETVRRTLKKTRRSPGSASSGVSLR